MHERGRDRRRHSRLARARAADHPHRARRGGRRTVGHPQPGVGRRAAGGPRPDQQRRRGPGGRPGRGRRQRGQGRTGPAPYPAGTDVTYTLTVGNAGPSDADDLHVVDTLPPGMTGVSASGPGWTCTVARTELVCDRPTLAAPVAPATLATSVITVTALIGSEVGVDTDLTNTAVVGTSTTDPDLSNNTDDATITASAEADLVIPSRTPPAGWTPASCSRSRSSSPTTGRRTRSRRSRSPTRCRPGSPTCRRRARGRAHRTSRARRSCATWTTSRPWPRVPRRRTWWSRRSSTRRWTRSSGGQPRQRAVADGRPRAREQHDPRPVLVTQSADVRIAKTHTGAVRVGDDVTFHLTVFNRGPSDARDVVVTDPLPAGLTYVRRPARTGPAARPAASCAAPTTSRSPPTGSRRRSTWSRRSAPEAFPCVRNVADVDTSTEGDDRGDNVATDDVGVPRRSTCRSPRPTPPTSGWATTAPGRSSSPTPARRTTRGR